MNEHIPTDEEALITAALASTGRSCGTCSLCCKVLDIEEEITKQAGKWCQHCKPGQGGCAIYENRPTICRDFACLWLLDDVTFGEHWKPTRSKMVVHLDSSENGNGYQHLKIAVDAGSPGVWRSSPYYEDLKRIALVGLRSGNLKTKTPPGASAGPPS